MKRAKSTLRDGSALNVFETLIKNQGGDPNVIYDYSLMDLSLCKTDVPAPKDGYIKSFINKEVGFLCTELGGGRKVKTDSIDFGVGFYFHKKLADKVKRGDPLLTIYHREEQKHIVAAMIVKFQNEIIKFSKIRPKKPEVILEVLSNEKVRSC